MCLHSHTEKKTHHIQLLQVPTFELSIFSSNEKERETKEKKEKRFIPLDIERGGQSTTQQEKEKGQAIANTRAVPVPVNLFEEYKDTSLEEPSLKKQGSSDTSKETTHLSTNPPPSSSGPMAFVKSWFKESPIPLSPAPTADVEEEEEENAASKDYLEVICSICDII
jgi:hypothetical protein